MSGRPILQLYTTMEEFETLYERHDRTRSTSKTVTVDRQALIHILMDHGRMVERYVIRQFEDIPSGQRKVLLRCAARLKAQLAEVETARQAARAQLTEIERLPQRLLAQAFDGSA